MRLYKFTLLFPAEPLSPRRGWQGTVHASTESEADGEARAMARSIAKDSGAQVFAIHAVDFAGCIIRSVGFDANAGGV